MIRSNEARAADVGRPQLGGHHAVCRRAGRGAPAAHDAGGEGRPARQPLDRRRASGVGADRGSGRGRVAGLLNVAPMQDLFAPGGKASLEEASRDGLGHLTRVYGSAPVTPAQGAAELVRQQHVVLNASRLGIPALVHEECLTGFTTYGATVYPAAIAWAATFDPALVEQMSAAIGRDMAALGVHQGLSPVLTSFATTAGAESRRRWVRIPIS